MSGTLPEQPRAPMGRPTRLADLIATPDAIYSDWPNDVKGRSLYYVDGIVGFHRIFGPEKITFLKEKSYVDRAAKIIVEKTTWGKEVAPISWSVEDSVAANQLRRMRDKEPVHFTKAVQTIVACELALTELRPNLGADWVYTNMKIVPAVCWIEQLTEGLLAQHAKNDTREALSKVTGRGFEVLQDLAKGHCVTYETAAALLEAVNNTIFKDNRIGPIRFKPARKGLGRRDASGAEEVTLR
jgi:hypothetical protein